MTSSTKSFPAWGAGGGISYGRLDAPGGLQWPCPNEDHPGTAILHTDNDTPYVFLIGVIDAIYQPHRPYNIAGKAEQVPSFNVTFAVN